MSETTRTSLRADMPDVRGGVLGTIVALACLYATSGLLGFAVFVLLFKAGVLGAISVLFFRGLCLAALAFGITFGLLFAGLPRARRGLRGRDAFSAAVLSLSFNICFLVVVPVTVDRSISVFVLGEMAADPEGLYTPSAMSQLFTRVYVGNYGQIDRRLREQAISGNVERVGDAYRISARGRAFIAVAKWSSWLFGGDPRFASPPDPLRPR